MSKQKKLIDWSKRNNLEKYLEQNLARRVTTDYVVLVGEIVLLHSANPFTAEEKARELGINSPYICYRHSRGIFLPDEAEKLYVGYDIRKKGLVRSEEILSRLEKLSKKYYEE